MPPFDASPFDASPVSSSSLALALCTGSRNFTFVAGTGVQNTEYQLRRHPMSYAERSCAFALKFSYVVWLRLTRMR